MLLSVSQLSVSVGAKKILEKVSFQVECGERVVLQGSSGSGKTVLSRLIAGVAPSEIEVKSGTIVFRNQLITFVNRKSRPVKTIFYLPELSMLSLNQGLKIEKQLSAICKNQKKQEDLFQRLHLPRDILLKYPQQLSGGEVQRLLLLMALLRPLELLILDEPCNHLDWQNSEYFCRLLLEFLQETGSALILITHSNQLAKRLGEKFYWLEAGQLRRIKPPVLNLGFSAQKDIISYSISYLQLKDIAKSYTLNLPFKKFKREIFSGLNLKLMKGEAVLLVGPSGCGKSTLGKVIFGLTETDNGQIVFVEQKFKPSDSFFKKNQILFQQSQLTFNPRLNIFRHFLQVKKGCALSFSETELFLFLHQLQLEESFLFRYPWQLSAGQLQRLALLRIILIDPHFLFLDEPFNYLDYENVKLLDNFIWKRRTGEKRTMIVVTHNPEGFWSRFDRYLLFNSGQLITIDNQREVFGEVYYS